MLGMNELPNVRKHRNLEEYNSTSYMGAAFEQSWTEAPLDSIWRDRELRLANVGQGEVKYTYTNPLMGRDIEITETNPKKRLSVDEAKEQIKETGLPLSVPEASYTQEALDIIIERKRAELLRKDQMDRAKGIVPAVGQFTSMLAAQVVDPINIAASFVPVVAPARYTAMMSRATTAGARALTRAKVGAVEGVVGAAIVEPFVYRATKREQADYDMYDSMLNIGLGAVMGAGLHAGFGAVGDLMRKGVAPNVATATVKPTGETPRFVANAAPETREAMFKSAIAQEMEGRPTNVESVGNFDNKLNMSQRTDVFYHGTTSDFVDFQPSRQSGGLLFFTSDPKIASKYATLESVGYQTMGAAEEITNVRLIKEDFPDNFFNGRLTNATDEELKDILFSTDVNASDRILSDFESGVISKEKAMELYNDIEASITQGGNVRPVTLDLNKTYGSKDNPIPWKDAEKMGADGLRAKGYDSIFVEEQGGVAVAVIDPNQIKSAFNPLPKTTDTNQTLENTIRDDVKRGSDPEASMQADEAISKPEATVDDELEFAMESVQNLETITGIKGDDLTEFDNAILKAEEDAKALEAAVMCRLTK